MKLNQATKQEMSFQAGLEFCLCFYLAESPLQNVDQAALEIRNQLDKCLGGTKIKSQFKPHEQDETFHEVMAPIFAKVANQVSQTGELMPLLLIWDRVMDDARHYRLYNTAHSLASTFGSLARVVMHPKVTAKNPGVNHKFGFLIEQRMRRLATMDSIDRAVVQNIKEAVIDCLKEEIDFSGGIPESYASLVRILDFRIITASRVDPCAHPQAQTSGLSSPPLPG